MECSRTRNEKVGGEVNESCNMGVIEDIEHFVMQCPKYEKRRKIFLKDLRSVR